MRTFVGFFVLAIGLCMGAYQFQPFTPDHVALERALPSASDLAAGVAGVPNGPTLNQPQRTFSPQSPFFAAASPAATIAVEGAADFTAAVLSEPPKPAPNAWSSAAPGIFTEPGRRVAAAKPTDDRGRWKLVRNLQVELKRVGCFDGKITGSWSASTKLAMKEFNELTNASLPVKEPDYILLRLVRSHTSTVCGTKCPKNEGLSADGRCIPSAILAQPRPKGSRATVAAKSGRASSQWTTVTEAAPSEEFVPRPVPAKRPVALAGEGRAVEPLPGRMTVGGPGSAVKAESGNGYDSGVLPPSDAPLNLQAAPEAAAAGTGPEIADPAAQAATARRPKAVKSASVRSRTARAEEHRSYGGRRYARNQTTNDIIMRQLLGF